MTIEVNPIGLVGNDSDISCCWFALGSLWSTISDFEPGDGITIHAPDELLQISPRGQGDLSGEVMKNLGIDEIYLAPHIIDSIGLTGLHPGRNPIVLKDGAFYVRDRELDYRLGVSLIAMSGLEDKWFNPFLPVSLGGGHTAQEFLDVIVRERKWWEESLPFS